MTHLSVATPTQNYSESDDLIFEIGDEDIETKKKHADDRVGYGVESDVEEDDIEVGDDDDTIDEFADFDEDWDDNSEIE